VIDRPLLVRDIMTKAVITVEPNTTVGEIIDLLATHHISGLPVVEDGALVGIVTEADIIHREAVPRRQGGLAAWLRTFFASPEALAREFRRTHGLRAADIMTTDVVTIEDSAPVGEAVRLMEERKVKRLPVLREGKLVGIVSRADVLRAVARELVARSDVPPLSDEGIVHEVKRMLESQPWGPREWADVRAVDGVVYLEGVVRSEEERAAVEVAARAVPGVRRVVNDIVVIQVPPPVV